MAKSLSSFLIGLSLFGALPSRVSAQIIITHPGGGSGGSIPLPVSVANGGLGNSSYTTGGLLCPTAPTVFGQIAVGSSGQVLTSNGVGACATFQTGGGGGANVNLSNLSAVAINVALLPGVDNTLALGSATRRFTTAHLLSNTYYGSTSGSIGISAGATPTSYNITLPANAGSNGFSLTTNGAGVLSWTNVGAGGGANTSLSNLAAVALNTSILPGVDNTLAVGSSTFRYTTTHLLSATFYGSGSNQIIVQAPANPSVYTFTLPIDGGTNGFALTTNGSGTTSWTNISGGGSTITVGTTPVSGAGAGGFLFNNAGVVGSYSVTGTGTTGVLSTSPTFTTSLLTPLVNSPQTTNATSPLTLTPSVSVCSACGNTFAGNGVNITATNAVIGTTAATAAIGGPVNITAGNADRNSSGNALGGVINITSGQGIGTSPGGDINIKTPVDAAGLGSGNIFIQTGNGNNTNSTTGDINLVIGIPGAQSLSSAPGSFFFTGATATTARTSAGNAVNGSGFGFNPGLGQATSNVTGIGGNGGGMNFNGKAGGAASAASGVHTAGNGSVINILGAAGGVAGAGAGSTGGGGSIINISAGPGGSGPTNGADGTINLQFNGTTLWQIGNGSVRLGTKTLFGTGAPSAPSFGTSPTIVNSNGTAVFTVNVGTGGTVSTGTVTMPTITGVTGWACGVSDLTNPGAFITAQSATTATLVTVINYSRTTGAVIAWTASDVLQFLCHAY